MPADLSLPTLASEPARPDSPFPEEAEEQLLALQRELQSHQASSLYRLRQEQLTKDYEEGLEALLTTEVKSQDQVLALLQLRTAVAETRTHLSWHDQLAKELKQELALRKKQEK